MINISNLTMHVGARLLFDDVNVNLLAGERYGLVGANGTGKSTMLRILAGSEAPSEGDIKIAKSKQIGWLKQDQYRYETNRIVDAVIQGKPKLWAALQEKEKLFETEEWTEKTGYRLGELEEVINQLDGYSAESLAQTLLTGLGIPESQHFQPMSTLSGGYKLRVLLAQSLFENPDVLLLDEPTNHLDIMTIAWLEKYLKEQFQGCLIFVSHDLNFINNTATHILDIDYGEVKLYIGNHVQFMREKSLHAEQRLQEKKYLEKKIAHMQSFVDRFGAKATKARQAQARVKMIEKIELPDIKKSSRVSPQLQFTPKRASGKTVLSIHKLNKAFGEKKVLRDISLEIKIGEKIAIIGHNGIGKSTLLKILLDQYHADSGRYKWGYETHIAYFAQDHHELLKENQTVFEWLSKHSTNITETDLRKTLGHVLFTKDDVHKNILSLSGGEAARLLLAKIILEKSNVLILDEPTNHLDIEAINALAAALRAYKGTLILVSHDRHFVSQIANRVVAFTEQGIKDYHGSYKDYLKFYGDDFLNRTWLETQ